MKNLFYQLTGLIVGLIIGLSVAATALVTALLWMYYSVTKDSPGTDRKIPPKYRSKPRDEDIPLSDRVWANRADAEDFVRGINSRIQTDGYISLLDLKDMIGTATPTENDQYWGWTSVHGTTYWLFSGGVKVRLPEIERIME